GLAPVIGWAAILSSCSPMPGRQPPASLPPDAAVVPVQADAATGTPPSGPDAQPSPVVADAQPPNTADATEPPAAADAALGTPTAAAAPTGTGTGTSLTGVVPIMVIGSSNETGTCWRAFLWQKLHDAGFMFHFVGRTVTGPDCGVAGYDKEVE